jgi:hypothetical protein
MSSIHQLVIAHGKEKAREMVPVQQRQLVDIAAEILADEQRALGITYSGFCLTGFPHRKLADDASWERSGHNVTLLVQPGMLKTGDGPAQIVGVPYGARARIILIYLQTQAIRTGSREVQLGRSMREWMGRMDLSIGGETVRSLRDQARRISACHIRFFWTTSDLAGRRSDGFSNGGIVQSGLFLREQARQETLFDDTVTLDEAFYAALRDHPVPLLEAAIKALKEKSLSLDLYVWLAYRLHSLRASAHLSWASVGAQFGAGFKRPRAFRAYFGEALGAALAAYPDARVDVDDDGITLHPSRPPIQHRQ